MSHIPSVQAPAIGRQVRERIGVTPSPQRVGLGSVLRSVGQAVALSPAERSAQAGILQRRERFNQPIGDAAESELATLTATLEVGRDPTKNFGTLFKEKRDIFKGATLGETENILQIIERGQKAGASQSLGLSRLLKAAARGGVADPRDELRTKILEQVTPEADRLVVDVIGRKNFRPEDLPLVTGVRLLTSARRTRRRSDDPFVEINKFLSSLRTLANSEPLSAENTITNLLGNEDLLQQQFGDEFDDMRDILRALEDDRFKKKALFGFGATRKFLLF